MVGSRVSEKWCIRVMAAKRGLGRRARRHGSRATPTSWLQEVVKAVVAEQDRVVKEARGGSAVAPWWLVAASEAAAMLG